MAKKDCSAKKLSLLEIAMQTQYSRVNAVSWPYTLPVEQQEPVLELLRGRAAGKINHTIRYMVNLCNQHGIEATENKVTTALRKIREEMQSDVTAR